MGNRLPQDVRRRINKQRQGLLVPDLRQPLADAGWSVRAKHGGRLRQVCVSGRL